MRLPKIYSQLHFGLKIRLEKNRFYIDQRNRNHDQKLEMSGWRLAVSFHAPEMQFFLQHTLHLLYLLKLVFQILKFVITLSGKRDLFSLACLFTAVKTTTQWSLYCTPATEGNTPLKEAALIIWWQPDSSFRSFWLEFTGNTLLPRIVCGISTKHNNFKRCVFCNNPSKADLSETIWVE